MDQPLVEVNLSPLQIWKLELVWIASSSVYVGFFSYSLWASIYLSGVFSFVFCFIEVAQLC